MQGKVQRQSKSTRLSHVHHLPAHTTVGKALKCSGMGGSYVKIHLRLPFFPAQLPTKRPFAGALTFDVIAASCVDNLMLCSWRKKNIPAPFCTSLSKVLPSTANHFACFNCQTAHKLSDSLEYGMHWQCACRFRKRGGSAAWATYNTNTPPAASQSTNSTNCSNMARLSTLHLPYIFLAVFKPLHSQKGMMDLLGHASKIYI